MRGALRAWPVLTRAAAKMRGRFRLGIKLTIEVLTFRWGVLLFSAWPAGPFKYGQGRLGQTVAAPVPHHRGPAEASRTLIKISRDHREAEAFR